MARLLYRETVVRHVYVEIEDDYDGDLEDFRPEIFEEVQDGEGWAAEEVTDTYYGLVEDGD